MKLCSMYTITTTVYNSAEDLSTWRELCARAGASLQREGEVGCCDKYLIRVETQDQSREWDPHILAETFITVLH